MKLIALLILLSQPVWANKIKLFKNKPQEVEKMIFRYKNYSDQRCKHVCVWEGRIYFEISVVVKKELKEHKLEFFPGKNLNPRKIEGLSILVLDYDESEKHDWVEIKYEKEK
ncbi:MAG: hypothetical protein H6621_05440 [Halobacteriovoraceae bacterium]|nr:hypothetical protein [Halobacteriovoraceae bacterium]